MELQSRETESPQRRSSRPGRGLLHKGKSDTLIAASSAIERGINNWELSNLAQRISNRKSTSSGVSAQLRHLRDGNNLIDDEPTERAFINRAGSSTASNHQSVLSLAVAGPVFFSNVDLARGSSVSDAMKWEEDRDVQMDIEMDNADVDYKPGDAATIGIPSISSPPPLSLKFVDVTYRVTLEYETSRLCGMLGKSERKNVKEKEILHGITGYVMPGEVMALMGPSGSGKTTLINLLSGRVAASKSNQDGMITYNDMPYSKALKRRMGFVMQDDVLYPHLTVKETLVYAALLRLSKNLSKNEKVERAIEVIYELGLERCQDTIIGGPFLRGVSGGERKRVCMGQEILTDPSLLFLDEPTSGLDSTTALRIVHVLRQISQVGRTVITTIHQPSSRLFHMFDKLILLSEGHLIYFGKAKEAVTYFKSIGFSPRIAMNPADFLLDLASGNISDISLPLDLTEREQTTGNQSPNGGTISASSGRPSAKQIRQYLYKSYEVKVQPLEKRKLMLEQELAEQAGVSNVNVTGETNSREWSSTWWSQFSVLYVRGLRERRHEYLSWLRVTQVIASALAIGCLWWQSQLQTERQVSDQVGLLFFIATYWGFFPLFTALFTFPQERAILAKERASDMYRLSSYFMARTLSDLPLDFGLPVVFHIIVYFMARLRQDPTAFFLTLLIILLSTITSQGMGIAIGAAMMDLKKATTLASVVLLTFMLSGGYFVQSIPHFMLWLRHISYNNYTFKLLVKVQYHENQLYDCHAQDGCKRIAESPSLIDIPLSGGVKESMILVAMVFGYRLLAYIALRRMKTTV